LPAFSTAALVLAGSIAHADVAGRIEPRFFGGAPSVRDTCQALVSTRPSRRPATGSRPIPTATEISACLELVRAALSVPAATALRAIQDAVPGLSPRGARNRQLLSTYLAVQQLKPWVYWSAAQPGTFSLAAELSSVETATLTALSARGLLGAGYSAVLQAGISQSEPGGYAGRPPDAPNQDSTSAVVDLSMETEHIDIGGGFDFGLAFDVGREPLLVMVKTATSAAVIPAYINGLTTSTGFRVASRSTSTETAIAGRVGATRLGSDSTVIGSGGQAEPAVIAANDMAEWALFFDASIDFRWYVRDLWLAHLATQPLDPLVHIYAGVKHDQRFHRAGDLAAFDDPTGRIFFGFGVNPIRVADRGTEGSGNTLFTVGGRFEFEGAVRETDRLPSGFRLLLAVDVDLLKALQRVRSDGGGGDRRR
jgi:hypothetical protein